MAKKANKATPPNKVQEQNTVLQEVKVKEPFSFMHFKVQAVIIALIGIIFYANTVKNEYALDDRLVIVQNDYVKEGFAGIGKILGSDAYASYYIQQNSGNELPGGRYRPLSIVTFAIEQQFLGGQPEVVDSADDGPKGNIMPPAVHDKLVRDMHVRHGVNVLLYVLSIIILLQFLRKYIFPGKPLLPFIACLLFVIHPIHTEVVANVKSRDEILSLMFIVLTLQYALRYVDEHKQSLRTWSMVFFLLALLSKEYAVTLLVLVPLCYYLFRGFELNKAVKAVVPFVVPFIIYIVLRVLAEMNTHQLPGRVPDVMNSPYIYATFVQKVTSIVAVLSHYIWLLLVPHPLSSDYSYNQIPYSSLADPVFWVSLVVHLGLLAITYFTFKRRHPLCFALAFYLLHLALIGNIFINIGAPMGERLIYHSSFGFVIILAWFIYEGVQRIQPKTLGYGSLALLLVAGTALAGYKTIDRNKDWKSDRILFLKDVETCPNSLLIMGNAGSAYIDLGDEAKDSVDKKKYYNKALTYLNRAVAMDRRYLNSFLNRGVVYYQLGMPDKALADWDSVRVVYPDHPTLVRLFYVLGNYYFREGMTYGKAGNTEQAIVSFMKGTRAHPTDHLMWYNLGYAFFTARRYNEAANAFATSLRFEPNQPQTKRYMEQAKELATQASSTGLPSPNK